MSEIPSPLPAELLRRKVDADTLGFSCTSELATADIIIGQDFGYAVKFTYQNPLVLSPSVKHFVNPPANWYDFSIIELE